MEKEIYTAVAYINFTYWAAVLIHCMQPWDYKFPLLFHNDNICIYHLIRAADKIEFL